MITIANKNPNWNEIRAEYIAGGIGQRKLAEKHGVSYPTLRDKSIAEGWVKEREKAQSRFIAETVRKTASMTAESATTAERIRQKLLRRLEAEIDALPSSIGSQSRQSVITRTSEPRNRNNTTTKDMSKEYKLRDLTAAWRDLTDGLIDESEKDDSVRVIIDV